MQKSKKISEQEKDKMVNVLMVRTGFSFYVCTHINKLFILISYLIFVNF